MAQGGLTCDDYRDAKSAELSLDAIAGARCQIDSQDVIIETFPDSTTLGRVQQLLGDLTQCSTRIYGNTWSIFVNSNLEGRRIAAALGVTARKVDC